MRNCGKLHGKYNNNLVIFTHMPRSGVKIGLARR